ncbi:hypothetical protein AQZ52_03270 [Novosphingobium fuchskuhlense]|uniref:DUF3667 domain-containing protein n=1 Tax=Novosphingobium fuchskuhlense TaxID=1117702 RepID=A0A124JWA8_9SPHN|nr:DUF3667 domain-containing protein [Novosphingobium fuchskuhlense]KUR73128.1 hypothetical protein AQZ52_03270 [Novosphingobium fuchskuhlense]
MSEAQVLGDAIGAGLTARTIEPKAGESDRGHTHESACLNCGTELVGSYCHSCGQAAHVHRTIGAFFHDLLHGVFHFEGKVWRTLPMLALRPGQLTREYIDGRRARYVSPLALFLFSVFIMFAVFQKTAGELDLGKGGETAITAGMSKSTAEVEKALQASLAKRTAIEASGGDTDDVDVDIAQQKRALATMRRIGGEKLSSTGFSILDQVIDETQSNPKLVLYKMQSHAYKYSWALVPISIPFLWLLFPFSRRFHLYDHTVFVTYSLSFMTLLFAAGMLAGYVGADILASIMTLIPPVHMYKQVRGTYGIARMGAVLRTFALLLFATIALSIYLIAIAAEAGAG